MASLEERSTFAGQWRVVHHVESSRHQRFVGLSIEFLLSLAEFGGALVGSGRKVRVNGKPVPESEVSLLDIGGALSPDGARLHLLERPDGSTDHSILGEIWWQAAGEDHAVGRFQVDLGQTTGRSEGFRLSSSAPVLVGTKPRVAAF